MNPTRERQLGIHESDLGVKPILDRELVVVIHDNEERSVAIGNGQDYVLLAKATGIDTSFTSADGKLIQAKGGIIYNISPVEFIVSQMYDLQA